MSKEPSGLKVTPKSIAIDIVMVIIAWYLFAIWFAPHVPSQEEGVISLVSGYTAIPAAGTFWLCLQMFKVTLAHQKLLKKERAK